MTLKELENKVKEIEEQTGLYIRAIIMHGYNERLQSIERCILRNSLQASLLRDGSGEENFPCLDNATYEIKDYSGYVDGRWDPTGEIVMVCPKPKTTMTMLSEALEKSNTKVSELSMDLHTSHETILDIVNYFKSRKAGTAKMCGRVRVNKFHPRKTSYIVFCRILENAIAQQVMEDYENFKNEESDNPDKNLFQHLCDGDKEGCRFLQDTLDNMDSDLIYEMYDLDKETDDAPEAEDIIEDISSVISVSIDDEYLTEEILKGVGGRTTLSKLLKYSVETYEAPRYSEGIYTKYRLSPFEGYNRYSEAKICYDELIINRWVPVAYLCEVVTEEDMLKDVVFLEKFCRYPDNKDPEMEENEEDDDNKEQE